MISEDEIRYYRQLDERQQRVFLGLKAKSLGSSGVRLVSEAFGVDPKTVRKNTEQAYVGCLVVRLRQCRMLYQRIEGVWQGIMGSLPQGGKEDLSRVV